MKNLSVAVAMLLLFSCTANPVMTNVSPSPPPSNSNIITEPTNITVDEISKDTYIQIEKKLEDIIGNKGVKGISTDRLGNTYMISSYGTIIKIDKSTNTIESKNNDNYYFGSLPNMFFNIDSKGNGYFIPPTFVIDTIREDPVTGKVTGYENKFSISKINNLKITDTYVISIQDSRFKSYCVGQDDCSDLYLNVGGKNHSLNKFLDSKKEFIENDDLRLDIVGNKEFFNSRGDGFYTVENSNTSTVDVYSFINGVNKKTDISLKTNTNQYNFNCNIDHLGNGYILYKQDEKSKFRKISNYIIGSEKELNSSIANQINNLSYINLNDKGNGFVIYQEGVYYKSSKIVNFEIDNKKEILVEDGPYMSRINNVDVDGNGYIAFNVFDKVDSTGLKSLFKSRIFAVKDYNVIVPSS